MANFYTAPASASPAGNDSNPGTIGAPKETINAGKDLLGPGDTLFVRTSTYVERITSCPSGTSWSNIVRIAAYPGDTVWMVPDSSMPSAIDLDDGEGYIEFSGINVDSGDAWWHAIGLSVPAHHIRVRDAEIIARSTDNSDVSSWAAHGLELTNQSPSAVGGHEIVNMTISGGGRPGSTNFDNGYAIYAATPNCLIDGCDLYDSKGAGIHTFNDDGSAPSGMIIRNNRIHGMSRLGSGPGCTPIVTWNTGGCLIYNNLIYDITAISDAGAGGITIGGSSDGSRVWNNTIYDVANSGISIGSGTADTEVRNNIVYQQGGDALYVAGSPIYTADHNLIDGTNPGFVNATAGDFRITNASPAYYAGVFLPAVSADIDGVPYHNPPSIGAHEVGSLQVDGDVVIVGRNTGNTFQGTQETRVAMDAATTNFGNLDYFSVEKYSPGNVRHSLIRADVSWIAPSRILTSAVISLYIVGAQEDSDTTIEAVRCLRPWTELGATWNTEDGGTAWTTPGAEDETSDIDSTVSATLVVPDTVGIWVHMSGAQLTADFQAWIAQTLTNNGHKLRRSDDEYDLAFRMFGSSEAPDGQRWYVTLILEEDDVVPGTGALLLMTQYA